MSITVNTNMAAIRIQENLQDSTDGMNRAMVRMSSGLKINSASDDAAGFSVATKLSNTISGNQVAQDNVSVGQDLLSTTEGVLDVVQQNLARIQDLMIQASSGTYSSDDLAAIKSEVVARLEEITTLTSNATFNGKTLFSGENGQAITIQSGTTKEEQTVLTSSIFAAVSVSTLKTTVEAAFTKGTTSALSSTLSDISTKIDNITERQTDIGACQNKLEAVSDALEVMNTNLTSALSTIQDSDTAEDSASYVQQQILQEISTTLLSSANQAASIAYTLVQGTQ